MHALVPVIIMEDAGGDDLASKPKIDLVGACLPEVMTEESETWLEEKTSQTQIIQYIQEDSIEEIYTRNTNMTIIYQRKEYRNEIWTPHIYLLFHLSLGHTWKFIFDREIDDVGLQEHE
ncbi:hypothetical protein ACJX0J_009291 [Zea mays]